MIRLITRLIFLASCLAAFLRQIFPYEYAEGTFICDDCFEVYDGIHKCSRATQGFCIECGRVQALTKRFNCSACGSRSVTDVHFIAA